MKRIATAFATAAGDSRAALIGYLTAFDPDRDASLQRLLRACEAGLDVLELGVPFSDPTADGPRIQGAMVRALAAGATLDGVLELAAAVRARFELPIVLFSYANPLVAFGAGALCEAAAQCGIDGLLVVDVPPEHATLLRDPAASNDLAWVGLVAPTTPQSRIVTVAAASTGFVYAVTLRGVTGSALDTEHPELAAQLASIRSATDLPIAAGFGVRTPEQARSLARLADGVVVGSALIAASEQSTTALTDLVVGLREGVQR